MAIFFVVVVEKLRQRRKSRKEEKETVGRGLAAWTMATTDIKTTPIGTHDSTPLVPAQFAALFCSQPKWSRPMRNERAKVYKSNVFLKKKKKETSPCASIKDE